LWQIFVDADSIASLLSFLDHDPIPGYIVHVYDNQDASGSRKIS
jgi:hypothetical protein